MGSKKKLKIWQNKMPVNPFEEWDSEPGLISQGSLHGKDYSEGTILEFIQSKATKGIILRHQKAIAEILEIDLQWFVDHTAEEKADEIRWNFSDANVEQLGKLCELFKLPYKQYTSTGYSQSNWTNVLIVLTDAFFEYTGCKRENSDSILEGTAELFNQWAWGDVYGFSVVEIETCECCENESEKVIDSCAGFYGTDFENNGMMDHVPEELHEELKNFDTSNIEY